MVALSIADTKDFMQKLLIQNVFDRFYLLEGEVETFASFRMDGALNRAYYTNDETEILEGRACALWSEMKPVVFQLMKGKKLPVHFRFVLQLSEANTDWLLEKYNLQHLKEQLCGLYLNIRYQEQKIVCITGLSYRSFVMDKTLEHIWDETAEQFMKQNHILLALN